MSENSEKKAEGTQEVPTPDCSYCGQVGGIGQFDTTCGEHDSSQAIGWVIEGKLFPKKS